MEEREIDLIDMIMDILSHWRGLLVSLLIGALLMGGFSYVKSYQSTGGMPGQRDESISLEDQLKELEVRLKTVENLLSDAEKAAVYAVINDEQEYIAYQQYMNDPVLMQIDPYNVPKIDMIFKIQADDMLQSYTLKSIYEDLVNGVGMLQWVEEQTGISSTVAGELITTPKKSDISLQNKAQETIPDIDSLKVMIVQQDATPGTDYLKVMVIHYDESECERLAQCVKDYIKQQYEQMTQEFGKHEVTLLSESAGCVMDTAVRDKQLLYSKETATLLTNYTKVQDSFTDDQESYYGLLKEKAALSEKNKGSGDESALTAAKPSISIKYVVVGAFLFAFIYAGILFVLYVFNTKLRVIDELQRLYNISQLGLIVKDEGKKKFIIDRWLDALRNWNKRQFTREQSLELAAAAIKISAGKQELDTIYLMGCNLKAGADVVCQALKEKLASEGISVEILDNVLYDAEVMEELESAKSIVLVEKAMSTMYNEILSELELASRQGLNVLGGIVVE